MEKEKMASGGHCAALASINQVRITWSNWWTKNFLESKHATKENSHRAECTGPKREKFEIGVLKMILTSINGTTND